MEEHSLYWEDVKEGDKIPPVPLEITRNRTVMIVSATRDIFPLHHDQEFAEASGHKAPAVATAFLQGFLGRCLTDWAGPAASIRKLGIRLRAPSYTGDTVTAKGKVSKKYVEGEEHKLDCELSVTKQDGTVSVEAQARLVLPSRKAL